MEIDGEWRDLQKQPATGLSKSSEAGRLSLVRGDGGLQTVRTDQLAGREDLLEPVFRDGAILRTWGFGQVQPKVRSE